MPRAKDVSSDAKEDLPASFDLSDQKHLALDARRRRFDPKSRHGGYGGRTTVRAQPAGYGGGGDGLRDIFLKITRPRDAEGNMMVTELDEQMPHLISVDEKDGQAASHIYALPELLEAECESKSTGRDKANPDIVVSTYLVRGTGWLAPGEEERHRLELRRQARLSLAARCPNGSLRTILRLRDTPLEKIGDLPSLLDRSSKFSTAGKAGSSNLVTRASVLTEDERSCWCAEGEGACKDYLQVDLGVSCEVKFVSTQGRFPPIQSTDKETGTRCVHEGSPHYMNWVKTYELSYRAESGHEWITLGELKGNVDMTTEVAHDLSQFTAGGPLEFRYLRFRPLTYHRQPAMRVGVYGHQLGQKRSTGKAAVAARGEGLVTFQVCHVKEGANLRRAPFARSTCALGCCKCSKYRGPCAGSLFSCGILGVRRKRFKEGVVEEVRQISAEGWSGLAPWLEDEGDDAAAEQSTENPKPPTELGTPGVPEALEAAGSVPVVPPVPVGPRLLRMRSRSDPDLSLSRKASSSVGDDSFSSFVQVEETEGLLNYDMDEWVQV